MAQRVTRSISIYEGPLKVSVINRALGNDQRYYNHYRPHDGLELETPMRSSTVRSGRLICLTGIELAHSVDLCREQAYTPCVSSVAATGAAILLFLNLIEHPYWSGYDETICRR